MALIENAEGKTWTHKEGIKGSERQRIASLSCEPGSSQIIAPARNYSPLSDFCFAEVVKSCQKVVKFGQNISIFLIFCVNLTRIEPNLSQKPAKNSEKYDTSGVAIKGSNMACSADLHGK